MLTIRPELEPLPATMQHLPLDARGYPVPWFVGWMHEGHCPGLKAGYGKRERIPAEIRRVFERNHVDTNCTCAPAPDFRVAAGLKRQIALQLKYCWVCGQSLKNPLTRRLDTFHFLIGPMCAVNRITSEPACHRLCAEWSARNCPFMSRPHMRRREDEELNVEALVARAPGIAIPRNPGVGLVWPTWEYELVDDGRGGTLIALGELAGRPTWWCEGRPATRAEVVASIESGVPLLEAACDKDVDPQESRVALRAALNRARALLPAT